MNLCFLQVFNMAGSGCLDVHRLNPASGGDFSGPIHCCDASHYISQSDDDQKGLFSHCRCLDTQFCHLFPSIGRVEWQRFRYLHVWPQQDWRYVLMKVLSSTFSRPFLTHEIPFPTARREKVPFQLKIHRPQLLLQGFFDAQKCIKHKRQAVLCYFLVVDYYWLFYWASRNFWWKRNNPFLPFLMQRFCRLVPKPVNFVHRCSCFLTTV